MKEYQGLFIREGEESASDMAVIDEVEDYSLALTGTILDLGANIGAFARRFAGRASKIISVEPDTGNYGMLLINTQDLASTVEPLLGAVVGPTYPSDMVTLYRGDWPSRYSTVTSVGRDRESHDVHAYKINDLIDTYHPTAIKADIEGGEFELFDTLLALPPYVKAVSVEIHRRSPTKKALARMFITELADQGYCLNILTGLGSAQVNWVVNAQR